MAHYAGRRVFRASRSVLGAVAVSEILFLAGAWYEYRSRGLRLLTWCFIGLAILGLLGLLDALTRRIVLEADVLSVKGLWGNRRYPKQDIVGVEEAKGVAPALRLRNGQWAKLPGEVGGSIGNSVRAWLKAEV
jgi:hypothetical protein